VHASVHPSPEILYVQYSGERKLKNIFFRKRNHLKNMERESSQPHLKLKKNMERESSQPHLKLKNMESERERVI
jgi:hypothetical protein